ncbi:MAG: peptidoglycan DD-metalloendopeptidase family protein [Bacteroidales bacterium]|jgi:septal ring factor EnvC (AmiA/AmiB activator)|nr:peptidoglycan DD-metalloendopeptidase family protein [Bacteroidales bacterium]
MKNNRVIYYPKVFRTFLLIAALLFSLPIFAQNGKSSAQLKQDKQKIEKEIANTQKLLKKNESNQKAAVQQAALLRQQIQNREKMITNLNSQIIQMEDEQEQNTQEIKQLEKRLAYMKADYAQVVYNAYRNRRLLDKVTFILAADDFSQMFRRMRYFAIFSRSVREQSERIQKTTEELTKKNEEIVMLKNDKLVTLSSKEQEIKNLENDRRKKTQNAEKLKKESQKLNADLKKKQQQRKEIDAAIQRAVKAEIAQANAERAKKSNKSSSGKTSSGNKSSATTASSSSTSTSTRATAAIALTPEEATLNTSFINNKGKLPWPVAKGAKVSDFGNYPHPDVPSVQIENHGIDIMVEAGTPARAVFDGVVTGVMNIMGTTVVMIRHGEYLTVYQNLSSARVKKGDKVTTKQTIGTVAQSPTSNTYELHFEIWKNDRYVNPNEWLARK